MLIKYKKNKREQVYYSGNLPTNEVAQKEEYKSPITPLYRATSPLSKGSLPFKSCEDCGYASHGFLCYSKEGDCLRTRSRQRNRKEVCE